MEKNLVDWIHRVSLKRNELNGFAICPFAKKAYDDGTIFAYRIDGEPIQQITTYMNGFSLTMKYEVILFCDVDNTLSDEQCINAISELNKLFPSVAFLKDHPNNPGFINGVNTGNGEYPIILAQPKEKLLQFRETLKKTPYYDIWDEEYLKEIWSYGDASKTD